MRYFLVTLSPGQMSPSSYRGIIYCACIVVFDPSLQVFKKLTWLPVVVREPEVTEIVIRKRQPIS